MVDTLGRITYQRVIPGCRTQWFGAQTFTLAPARVTPSRLAPVRLQFRRSAFVKSHPVSTAPDRSFPTQFTEPNLAPFSQPLTHAASMSYLASLRQYQVRQVGLSFATHVWVEHAARVATGRTSYRLPPNQCLRDPPLLNHSSAGDRREDRALAASHPSSSCSST